MTVAWVAGSVRAKAIARRRLGAAAARQLAASGSLPQALRALAATPYGRDVHPGQTLGQAQHAVAAAILWDLRVLAGWLPHSGLHALRALAGWFEIANTDELLLKLRGGQAGPEFRLGALATGWPQLRDAASQASLRAVMAVGPWGDPGGDSAADVRLRMRARWAASAAGLGEPAQTWAAAGAALLVAGVRFAAGKPLPAAAASALRGLLSEPVLAAATLPDMQAALPRSLRWVLGGISSPGGLWRAEAAWWARVERDAVGLLRTSGYGSAPVLGAAALLGADAWRVRAALEIAARGGGPLEAFDAVA